nr:hypothetical protein [Synechococcus sp. RSCCF101]
MTRPTQPRLAARLSHFGKVALPRALKRSRWPLPTSAALAALLTFAPLIALRLSPPGSGDPLGRLPEVAELMQAFPIRPEGSPPELWRDRLGEEMVERVWERAGRRSLWWQFWPSSGDFAPVLAFPARWWPSEARGFPPHSRLEGELLLVAAEALQIQQLARQLAAAPRPMGSGWVELCRSRLLSGPAVLWSNSALEGMLGSLVPLMQPIRRGCLSLSFEGRRMDWQGVGTTSALSATAQATLEDGPAGPATVPAGAGSQPGLEPDVLLQLEGQRLGWLLDDLLERRAIRSPLESRYGLTATELSQLSDAPFRLRIRASEANRFKAVLELGVIFSAADQAGWQQRSRSLARLLEADGFRMDDLGGESVVLTDPEGQPVAQWRWQPWGLALELGMESSPDQGGAADLNGAALTAAPVDVDRLEGEGAAILIDAKPDELARLNLLPRRLPPPIRMASGFSGRVGLGQGPEAAPSYELSGWLVVPPAAADPAVAAPSPAPGPEPVPEPASLPASP